MSERLKSINIHYFNKKVSISTTYQRFVCILLFKKARPQSVLNVYKGRIYFIFLFIHPKNNESTARNFNDVMTSICVNQTG